ncbi:MAG: Hcp family type VI secretion system effector [Acetobacteraceae bacterium]
MPLYMKYGDIDGKVETAGYVKWIEVHSLQWGIGRSIASPVGTSHDREAAAPSVSGITLGKMIDVSTNKLLENALGGGMNTKVEIALCTTGKGQLIELARFTLSNTALSGYSIASNGDRPLESLTLNFTKVGIKYTSLNMSLDGSPTITTYDLAKQTLNG